ncbi:MAG: FAD-binding oxidoreductase [Gammaproteobacteria bacterium]|nr:FAD-binding oxidoreductase [Gammaproteobacteria bacterium]
MGQNIAVLGAGIQGVCATLALLSRGHNVTLIDKASGLMTRTSLRNEGKLHLGFVYANDPSRNTSRLMLRSALYFRTLLEGWLNQRICWDKLKSTCFGYLVARDSCLSVDKILGHFELLQKDYQMLCQDDQTDYLEVRPERLWRLEKENNLLSAIDPGFVTHCISTEEVSIDTDAFAAEMQQHLLGRVNLTTLFNHEVISVSRNAESFLIECANSGKQGSRGLQCDQVVNCLWEDRLKIDRQLGFIPTREWVYRLKYRVLGALPEYLRRLPSFTMILGPFGDIVNYKKGPSYLSWYPACRRGWCRETETPTDWERACDGRLSTHEQHAIAQEILLQFDQVVPGIAQTNVDTVDAGIIFSWGATDINDLGSTLHRRDEIGVESHNGYHSINTGKFVCAPLFAQRLLDNL